MGKDIDTVSVSRDEHVYTEIRSMIIRGELKPGEQIVQKAVAAKLGVSRTPLRKAIATLARENFVEMTSRGSAYVRSFSESEFISVWEIRAVLEGLASRMAAKEVGPKHVAYLRALITSAADQITDIDWTHYRNADREFHEYLLRAVNDPLLISILESFHVLSFTLAQGLLRSPADTLPEHLEILDAIEARDADKAERAMVSHIRKSNSHLKRKLSQPTSFGMLPDAFQTLIITQAEELAAASGETVVLAVEDKGEARIIFVVEGHSLLRAAIPIGTRLPLHATAVGKALLASKDSDELASLLGRYAPTRFTDATITDSDELAGMLYEIRKAGISMENGEYQAGLASVAMTLRHADGSTVAIGITLPEVRLCGQSLSELGEMLLASTNRISSAA
ncbi:MAG: FCD domain-containing protein [Bacteroidetes bacterium SB0662_bin_6]|nr:FCD domain-containing protein [Bacteroidetes bacterium SB0668_bin_1]MYE04970.1 FCD domain-containing protein [Bacteroidetes bacterium SB0662_bin_6]